MGRKAADQQIEEPQKVVSKKFVLTQRQYLIQKLNDILYKTQRGVINDDQVSEILRLISHI